MHCALEIRRSPESCGCMGGRFCRLLIREQREKMGFSALTSALVPVLGVSNAMPPSRSARSDSSCTSTPLRIELDGHAGRVPEFSIISSFHIGVIWRTDKGMNCYTLHPVADVPPETGADVEIANNIGEPMDTEPTLFGLQLKRYALGGLVSSTGGSSRPTNSRRDLPASGLGYFSRYDPEASVLSPSRLPANNRGLTTQKTVESR